MARLYAHRSEHLAFVGIRSPMQYLHGATFFPTTAHCADSDGSCLW